jgi:hypothetical protein
VKRLPDQPLPLEIDVYQVLGGLPFLPSARIAIDACGGGKGVLI